MAEQIRTWIPILRRRGVPPLFYSLINAGYHTQHYRELLGIGHGCEFHRYVDGWVVIESADSEEFTDELFPRLDEPIWVDFFLRQCESVSAEVLQVGATIRATEHTAEDRASLLSDFMRFSQASIRVMAFLNSFVFVQQAIEARLRNALATELGATEDDPSLETEMQRLMLGGAQSPMATRALTDLAAIADDVSERHPRIAEAIVENPTAITTENLQTTEPALLSRLQSFLDDYDFLETDYYVGEPTSLARLLAQLSVFLARDTRHEVRPTPPTVSDDIASIVRTAQRMQYLREYRLEALFKAGRDCRALLATIGEALGLSYGEVLHLTFTEIQRALSSEDPEVDLAVIAQRTIGYASSVEDGVERMVVGDELAQLEASLPDAPPPSDRLIGVTAFPGQSVGTVRVVDRLDKADSLEVGDILVTSMTLPYHVPAMARAAAVLTDEGGILSHAAIVCRELGVLCVVGLESATASLLDGDRVRVTASESGGIVERVDATGPR
jgi:phosphohistidine swiveling domain-containing protein